jgi:hypothetical protein
MCPEGYLSGNKPLRDMQSMAMISPKAKTSPDTTKARFEGGPLPEGTERLALLGFKSR